MFNNREIAIAIWLVPFAVWILTKSEIRTSLAGVARSFLAWKVSACFVAMALYTAAMIRVLNAADFWRPEMVKDSAEWFFFTACAMLMRFITSRENDNVLRNVMLDNVKILIFLEFIMGTYVMSLPAELLFVPVVTFLSLIMTVAQLDESNALAAKMSKFLLGAIGVVVLGFAISCAVSDYQNLGTMNTIRGIAFPPLMSVLLVPFICVLIIIVDYENVFTRLAIGREKPTTVVSYAKWRIFFHCGLSRRRLRNLISRPREIMQIETNEDVDRLLRSTNPVSLG